MINKNVLNKTKQDLIKINIVVVSSFLLLFSIFIYSYSKGTIYNDIDSDMEKEFTSVTNQLSSSSLFYPVVLEDPRNMVYVYQGDRIRYYTENRYFDEIIPQRRSNKEKDFFTYSKEGHTFRELNINILDYEIQIIRNIDSEINSLRKLTSALMIAILIAIISTYYIGLYLTKKALIPIETAWNNQTQFVQDASHELRTPIAIIQSKLETMLQSPNNTINEEVENIADAMKETRRVRKMISDLLSLTKEDAVVQVNIEEIDIKELIQEIGNDYEDIAQVKNRKFSYILNLQDSKINTDKQKLRQIILILLDNAFKYTKEEDIINIVTKENNKNIEISVIDSGIGISKEDINDVFKRFYRSEDVRSKDIDGSGIGLSIAKMLANNIDAQITVESVPTKQTQFSIILKKNNKK